MRELKLKENLTFYNNGIVYASKKPQGHITGEYDIESDVVVEGGKRVITLNVKDKTDHINNVNKLVRLMAKKMGEPDNKILKAMLKDTLVDYYDEEIVRILELVEKDGIPVKAREGCYKIIIGDGRRKESDEIMLRD